MANQLRRDRPTRSGQKATGKRASTALAHVEMKSPKTKGHTALTLDAHGTFRAVPTSPNKKTASTHVYVMAPSGKSINTFAFYNDALLDGTSGIPYGTIAARSASENSEAVRLGIKPAFVKRLASDLNIDQSVLTDFMGFARSTFTRKAKKSEALSSGESAIALGVARIVGEVSLILVESGDPDQMNGFNVAEWTGGWLTQEVPALGNKRPIDFLDNSFGQETVLQLVRQMQSGTFA